MSDPTTLVILAGIVAFVIASFWREIAAMIGILIIGCLFIGVLVVVTQIYAAAHPG